MEQWNIFVKDFQGKTHAIKIGPKEPLINLTKEIQKLTNVPVEKQRLSHSGKDILNNPKNLQLGLTQFNITNQSTIYLLIQLKGGSMANVQFNSIEKSQKNYFHKDAPKWRTIRKGMTVEGMCYNEDCEARNQNVWVPHRFGTFNVSKIVHKCACPACGQKLINVNNIAFYMCKWKGEGSQSGQEIKIPQGEHTDSECFVSFKNGDEDQRCWDYLEFTVESL